MEIVSEPRQPWNPVMYQPGPLATNVVSGWYQRSRGVFRGVAHMTAQAAGTNGVGVFVTLPISLVSSYEIGGTWNMISGGGVVGSGVVVASSTSGFVLYANTSQYNAALAGGDGLYVSVTGSY